MPADIPTLTAAQTRAAEQMLFDAGMPIIDLMEQAGQAVAQAIIEHFTPVETLVLCGPGNNGGDGYVVARLLHEAGWPVRVAATGEPRTDTARIARDRWNRSVELLDNGTRPAPLLIDALFGTGLVRPLDEPLSTLLNALANAARHVIAIDLPSGVETDSGALLGTVPQCTLTVALGVYKPAHHAEPAASRCGTIVLGDIGLIDAAQTIADQS